jgi:hypothetical protein
MRLFSFLKQVETTLAMLKPECSTGWKRRADYQTGAATYWHEQIGLILNLRSCELGGGRFSLQTRWVGQSGLALFERTYFCGGSSFDWQSAADSIAEAMPETSDLSAVEIEGQNPALFKVG